MIRAFARCGHMVRNKFMMLERKKRSGTFKRKKNRAGVVRVPLFWKPHFFASQHINFILYHVTGSCKGPLDFLVVVMASGIPLAIKAKHSKRSRTYSYFLENSMGSFCGEGVLRDDNTNI